MGVERYTQPDILGYRGVVIYCETCREIGDPIMWKVLHTFERKPKTRIPKEEEEKISQIIYRHNMEFPTGHKTHIIDMKAQ